MLYFFIVSISLLLYGFALLAHILKMYFNSKSFEEGCIKDLVYEWDRKEANILLTQVSRVLMVVSTLFWFGFAVYFYVQGTPYQGHLMEWLNLIIRWGHVVAGVMWIGASFYFVFLENNLNRTHEIRDELAGNLWAVHGGGFYFLEKYKIAPKVIPRDLHWFKYEAYFTWITGFAMLWVVYYMDAKAFLIDSSVADISETTAIFIGIGTMIFGWIVYDALCKSPLINNQKYFAVVGLIIFIALAYFLTHTLSSRAAFIHVGALIGTIMAWNVYFVIIPGQKAMVKAATTGLPLDAALGKKALQRSLHNNYFTLPVIFIMISNHFPSTFGHEFNWIVLIIISVASAGVKHYWNLLERGEHNKVILPISIATILLLAYYTAPKTEKADTNKDVAVEFWQVQKIVYDRCVQCHSRNPTDDKWTSAPNGVFFDKPQEIVNLKDKILSRVVVAKNMPQGNKTNMTDSERDILKNWINQGAKIND